MGVAKDESSLDPLSAVLSGSAGGGGGVGAGGGAGGKQSGGGALGGGSKGKGGRAPSAGLKPPLGMSREVYNLLRTSRGQGGGGGEGGEGDLGISDDPNLPTMMPGNGNVSFSQGQNNSRRSSNKVGAMSKEAKVSKWVWAPFSSSARNDGAEFKHWVKAGVEYPDYPFARFNVHLDPVEFTEEEYNLSLSNSEWTRTETDILMGLCRRLDLRWAIIHDQYTATPPRTIEQLQVRMRVRVE